MSRPSHTTGLLARNTRLVAALAIAPLLAAAGHTPIKADLHADVLKTIATFQTKDPGLKKFFDGAVGYAVFPGIAQGALGVGAANGSGELMVGGNAIGKTGLTQVTVGLQVGGQSYAEVIFFETQAALDGFKKGDFAFSAEAKAVALTAGASASAAYRGGVAVFTATNGGLMYSAAIGGQKFSFKAY
jgi:lipid-binding SYLF domain-containing protein